MNDLLSVSITALKKLILSDLASFRFKWIPSMFADLKSLKREKKTLQMNEGFSY